MNVLRIQISDYLSGGGGAIAGDRLHRGLNPMAGVIEGFRWTLLGTDTQPGPIVIASSTVAVLLLASGASCFRRMRKTFADVVQSSRRSVHIGVPSIVARPTRNGVL